ncbi:DUF1405 domain-containing protein [Paenibacillus sp. CAA11]|uniref:DUF1405 domain-containing protein n=1 Tax=Paenibacillus sp. CAA11 TaxID=1532905 RepID=UPI000D375A35|nr:DUF1405 domain-containing protein [Paenibacillus sp. CAA11]AWB44991.1 DUF1405 domain-containing protein [Paenibacillus sp. CAA11]
MRAPYLISRRFLLSKPILWLLFGANLLGTVYGYVWYGSQLKDTVLHYPLWTVIFVPDSPTASLFFTLSLAFLLFENKIGHWYGIRSLIEGLGVVTSVKYGIWAVSIIFAGQHYGDVLVWEDGMLTISHLAMAIEALLFVRFFHVGSWMIMTAGLWTLLNDTVDYTYGVYPWLPVQLESRLIGVQNFTFGLTVFSILATWLAVKQARRR